MSRFFSRILWGGGGFLSVTLSCGYGVKFRFFVRGTFFSCAKTWFLIWDIWKIRYAFFEVHRSRFFSDVHNFRNFAHDIACGNLSSLKGNVSSARGNAISPEGNVSSLIRNVSSARGNTISPKGNVSSLKGNMSSHMHASGSLPGPEPTVVASALVFLQKLLILGTPKKSNVSNPFFQFSEFRDFSRL